MTEKILLLCSSYQNRSLIFIAKATATVSTYSLSSCLSAYSYFMLQVYSYVTSVIAPITKSFHYNIKGFY